MVQGVNEISRNLFIQPLQPLTGVEQVGGGGGAKKVSGNSGINPFLGAYSFGSVPEYTPPVIEGGTHITGLGPAGKTFDSYKYFN